jgi:hypothetical protein
MAAKALPQAPPDAAPTYATGLEIWCLGVPATGTGRTMNNEHHSFFQVSDGPLGLMETRDLNGRGLRRLGSRLGFIASLGYRRVSNNLSGNGDRETQTVCAEN